MSFVNADGTLNIGQMISEASKNNFDKFYGTFTARLKSAEIGEAFVGGVKSPTAKTLTAVFTVLTGEHEKREIYLRYKLFNNKKADGTPSVGSSSGTVRFFTELAAIGEAYVDGKDGKILYDKDGNLSVLGKNGGSLELLKKLWMTKVAGKTVTIESKEEVMEDRKTGTKTPWQSVKLTGLAGPAKAADATIDDESVTEDDEEVF